MTGDQLLIYITQGLSIPVLIPLLILVGISVSMWVVLGRAQNRNDFFAHRMLIDPVTGFESSEKLISFGCFAVTSWALAVIMFAHKEHIINAMITYMAFWSGTSIAKDIVAKWDGRAPFTRSPESPPQ